MSAADRLQRLADIEVFEREVFKANIEFARKPTWMQAAEEGDRLADGSDEQEFQEREEGE